MKSCTLIAAAFALTACGSADNSHQKAAAELPAFNTYSEAQMSTLTAFGMAAFDPKAVTSIPLKDGMGVIFGYGGNILVSTGKDGAVIVDSQFPEIYEAIEREIVKLGGADGGKVSTVINTHWHFDHAEGNRAFGPLGAEIIAHENSKTYMQGANNINLVQVQYPQQIYPKAAIPTKTYATTLELTRNGQDIVLYNFGPAHTTGDSMVYFKTANVLHTGDVGNFTATTFIDADNGGTIDGVIKTVRSILPLINDETTVVPGHGKIANKARLVEFVEMLEAVRAQIATLKADGKTVAEVQAFYNKGSLKGTTSPLLIDRAYTSLD